jgi:hypothetical protein
MKDGCVEAGGDHRRRTRECCFPFTLEPARRVKACRAKIVEHPSMANDVIVPHGIRLVRPLPVLEPFVRYYGNRNARLGDTVVVLPVHARAAPILYFEVRGF